MKPLFKNLLVGVAVLVLGFTAWFVLRKNSVKQTVDVAATEFGVVDTAHISRIFISNKNGHTADLTRKGGQQWVLNNKLEAAPAMVGMLLTTLHDLGMKRPVTSQEREYVIRNLAVRHLKVEVYTAGQLAKSYFIGDEADEQQGNYALLDGQEQPYVVHIPSWQGFPSSRFNVNEKGWRSKHLFRSTPRTLQRVEVRYASRPEDNVRIEFTKGKFRLAGVERVDTAKLVDFLLHLKQTFVESYLDTPPQVADSLLRISAPFTVLVEDIDPTRSHTLRLYPGPEGTGADAMLGLIEDLKQPITMQVQSYKPLLISRKELTRKGSN
jgi:hypothetical protein